MCIINLWEGRVMKICFQVLENKDWTSMVYNHLDPRRPLLLSILRQEVYQRSAAVIITMCMVHGTLSWL